MRSLGVRYYLTICLSLARLIATAGIFVFHYLGHLGRYQYNLDFFSILVFCFLSGYLLNFQKRNKTVWIIRRYFGLMIPYWLVIFPVVIINLAFEYKTVSISSQIVTLLGGNLFLDDPLYVIAWYITFVLLLYCYALIASSMRFGLIHICLDTAVLLFFVLLGKGYYFISFAVGMWLSFYFPVSKPKVDGAAGGGGRVSIIFFILQRYCYSFFLIHGGVLLFFNKQTTASEVSMFWLALVVSSLFSVAVHAVSKPLVEVAVNKTSNVIAKKLAHFRAI